MKKIIIEDQVYNIQTKKPIRKLELWEEDKGNTIRRRLYMEGDSDSKNNYIDRFYIGDVEYKFTHKDVMNNSIDKMMETMKEQYDTLMKTKDTRFNSIVDGEIKQFISPVIKHTENYNYKKL